MYTEHFGLKERPFDLTPDPKLLYLNSTYNEALAVLTYGVSARKGFISLVGEAGTGKTTVLRRFVSELGDEAKSVFVFNPSVSFEEMLTFILSELEVEIPSGAGKLDLLQALNEYLLAELNRGSNVVILIDEAQDLSPEVLEELRLLSNLETDKEKIIQVVFAGQPEFDARLNDPSLRQLRQRIALRARLAPLSRRETAHYIRARLRSAGAEAGGVFTGAAINSVWRASGGIPRLINVACDSALVTAYANGKKKVTSSLVREVTAEMSQTGAAAGSRRGLVARRLGIACAVVGLIVTTGLWWPEGGLRARAWSQRAAVWVENHLIPAGLWAEIDQEIAYYKSWPGARGVKDGGLDPRVLPTARLAEHELESAGPEPSTHSETGIEGPTSGRMPGGDQSLRVEGRVSGESIRGSARQPEAVAPGEIAAGARSLEMPPEPPVGYPEAPVPTPPEYQPPVQPSVKAPTALLQPAAKNGKKLTGKMVEKLRGDRGIVAVKQGDTLTELAVKRYGRVSLTLLDVIRSANPAIKDIDLILAGQDLFLPAEEAAVEIQAGEDGTYAVWVVSARNLGAAQEYVKRLAERGFAGRIALVSSDMEDKHQFVRVWVEGFVSEDEARATASKFRREFERGATR